MVMALWAGLRHCYPIKRWGWSYTRGHDAKGRGYIGGRGYGPALGVAMGGATALLPYQALEVEPYAGP